VQRDAIAQAQQSRETSNGVSPDHPTSRGDARRELEPSDRDLVLRLRSGDGDALAVLYDRYAATVTGLARGILRDTRLAEEATHDVFLGLWQNPHGYDASRGPFAGWLFRVARNRAIDVLRRRRDQPFAGSPMNEQGESIDPSMFLVDNDPDPADQAVTALQREAVRRGLRELSADHQHLLELAYFKGMTQSEIAAHLNRPLGTVKTQIRSAMRKLADVLSASGAVSDSPLVDDAPTDHATSHVPHTRGSHAFDAAVRQDCGDFPGDSNRS
jgi:RNA polymerase sigma-70 factor (ECF subfamily)